MPLFQNFYKNVGIDLGTANFLIYLGGHGIVVNEPTLIALNNRTGQILTIGSEAKKMLDRAPAHISLIKPLINGVVSDFEMTEAIMKFFLRKIGGGGLFSRYRLAAMSVPTNLTEVERKSVEDAAVSAGISKVLLIDEAIASAVGARLPIEEPAANMIVDIGGGTTEVSMISVGGTVVSKSLKIAGQKLNDDIIRFIRDEFKLLIGEPTAEELKITIGSAIPMNEKSEMRVLGRDMATGLPKEVVVKDSNIRAAMQKSLRAIVEAVHEIIEEAPPELVGDILKRGIFLSGGGSLLAGLDRYIEREVTVKTSVVDDPLTCVVRGLGIIIENLSKYEPILSNQPKPKLVNI
jgi:rod shape-determining protein MreB